MAKLSKRKRKILETVDASKFYDVKEAVSILTDLSKLTKCTESLDVAINLGVDPRKSDQVVRGASVLPHGTGKTVKVAVFAQGAKAEEAKEAGADKVGFDDLAEEIQKGNLDFDVVIASPDAMRVVGKLGQILGPRGLMPNPKVGTVSVDVVTAVKNAKAGQVRYRTDKAGIIQCSVGKVGFSAEAVQGNIEFLLNDLKKAKPASSKGQYLQKLTLSSTQGPGLTLDIGALAI